MVEIPDDETTYSKMMFQILTGTLPTEDMQENIETLQDLGIDTAPGSYGYRLAHISSSSDNGAEPLTLEDHQQAIEGLKSEESRYLTSNLGI